MMNVKLNHVLKDLEGNPLKQARGQGADRVEEEVVLNKICSNALMQPNQKDDGGKKVEKYLLAMKVHNADEVELKAEEISLLKECIAIGYAPLVVGQAWNLLEQKE